MPSSAYTMLIFSSAYAMLILSSVHGGKLAKTDRELAVNGMSVVLVWCMLYDFLVAPPASQRSWKLPGSSIKETTVVETPTILNPTQIIGEGLHITRPLIHRILEYVTRVRSLFGHGVTRYNGIHILACLFHSVTRRSRILFVHCLFMFFTY